MMASRTFSGTAMTISVAMYPGATTLAVMPARAPSCARLRTIPMSKYSDNLQRTKQRIKVGADGKAIIGKVGDTVSPEEAREAARLTGLQILASARAELGSLDRIRRVVKVFGMVNCAPGFNRTPGVIDGCSQLFLDVFGEAGVHTRSAVGMAELPFDIATEIEAVFELQPENG